ncbi:MAG: undecaprenyldiphospho-muramoylpentapeptide beta-N-acetylglucosaminyltransferase [Eubacteriales bacterium]|nr:undecaprenyldiphospho-muramoylpentapeptide beta-N-acetylglucosaminyltransferase [Eubacteriales bacterium]
MKILFAGGGTAGHINPALAIAKYISERNPDWDILFIGTKVGLEKELIPKEGFNIRYITVKGFKRKLSLDNFKTTACLFLGMIQAKKILSEYKPDIVIGTGGYVSGPVVFMASIMKIPTLIHEQNVFPGVTVKILSRFADVVAISFEESKRYLKVSKRIIHTGNPIREEILKADSEISRFALGLNSKPFIVAFGGSLGADKINETLIEYIQYIYEKDDVQLMFGTGKKQYRQVMERLHELGINLKKKPHIKVYPYIYNMDNALAAADLVVCRAGAITLSEITAIGKPSILIPSPNVTNNHQEYNARALEKQGASIVLTEDRLNGKMLYQQIETLLRDTKLLKGMGKHSKNMGITNATEKIYHILQDLI